MRLAGAVWTIALTLALYNAAVQLYVPQQLQAQAPWEIEPLPEYAEYWTTAEACTGRQRPEGVTFWVISGRAFWVGPYLAMGFWDVHRKRIYLSTIEASNAATVIHEMIHALGIYGHAVTVFQSQCLLPP